MEQLKAKIKLPSSKNLLNSLFILLFMAQTLAHLFTNSGLLNVDELEHIHASWLVWSGKTPYLDFFEHHNPLLWYLFAPITGFMFDNVNVYYVARFSVFLAVLTSWFFIYKIITRYFGTGKQWVLALLLFGCGDYLSRNFVEFRPDVFMNLCFWSGLYFLFRYFETKQSIKLTISFALFTLSFFFLQKIILLLFFLGAFIFYALIKKQIKYQDFFKALCLPLLLFGIFTAWLFWHNMFALYFELNYKLNSLIPVYYGFHIIKTTPLNTIINMPTTLGYATITLTPSIILFSCAAILFYPVFLSYNTIYSKCIIFLLFAELGIRLLTFSPYAHYFSLFFELAAIVIACSFFKHDTPLKNKLYHTALGISCIIFASSIYTNEPSKNSSTTVLRMADFVIKNTSPDETVFNADNCIYNLFRPDPSYVWFQLNDIGYIYETNFGKKTNLDTLITQKMPTVIFAKDYTNTPLNERRAKKLYEYNADLVRLYQNVNIPDYALTDLMVKIPSVDAYIWNQELINKYYKTTEIEQLMILKDEYRTKTQDKKHD